MICGSVRWAPPQGKGEIPRARTERLATMALLSRETDRLKEPIISESPDRDRTVRELTHLQNRYPFKWFLFESHSQGSLILMGPF